MTSRLVKIALMTALSLCTSLSPVLGDSGEDGWLKVENHMNIAAEESALFSLSGNQIEVKNGSVLLEPKSDVIVRTPQSLIHAARKSLVLIKAQEGCEHIFVLLGPAKVIVGKHGTHLKSGDEAIITGQDPTYQQLVGSDEIGRRRFRMSKVGAGETSMALSEFSLVHVVEREPIVYKVIHGSSRDNRALRERLLKMAAVLNLVTSRHGPYTVSH